MEGNSSSRLLSFFGVPNLVAFASHVLQCFRRVSVGLFASSDQRERARVPPSGGDGARVRAHPASRADPARQSVTLHTTLGDLKVEVFCDEVPRTAENFLALCASGYYDGTKFHRRARAACPCACSALSAEVWRQKHQGVHGPGRRPDWCAPSSWQQRVGTGTDCAAGTGKGGASIWGGKFADEIRDTLKVCVALFLARSC